MSAASPVGSAIVARLLREPMLHFLVLGALLFAIDALIAGEPQAETGSASAGDPESPVITVGEPELDRLRASFRHSWKRDPDADELGDLVSDFVVDEVLLREGRARGLDREDEVVRQRVVEKMRAITRPQAAAEPSRAQLEGWFAKHAHRFRQGARLAFDQLYFDPKRRAAAGEDAEAAAAAALAKLASQPRDEPPPDGVGDVFVLRRRWDETPEQQIVNVFGAGFASAAMRAPIGAWQGPIRSDYGVHLVRVRSRSAARTPSFDEAAANVRADYQLVEARGARAVQREMLPRYRVELMGSARALAKSSAVRELLGSAR